MEEFSEVVSGVKTDGDILDKSEMTVPASQAIKEVFKD